MDENSQKTKSSTGLEPNIAAMLSYLLGFITGIIFLVIEKNDKFVRFHALQSIIVSGALFLVSTVLGWIPIIGWLIVFFLGPIGFIIWILLLYKAYKGQWYEFPIAGKIAKEQVDKINL